MNKCYRCAELEGCWAGLHGKGKKKGEVLCENHKLEAVDILNALKINFTEVEKNS